MLHNKDPKSPSSIAAEASFTFKRRVCVDKSVQQLECEVEWQDPLPIVISVRPGSEADRLGIMAGDKIASMNHVSSFGETRDALLPKLKERPLTLELEHTMPVAISVQSGDADQQGTFSGGSAVAFKFLNDCNTSPCEKPQSPTDLDECLLDAPVRPSEQLIATKFTELSTKPLAVQLVEQQKQISELAELVDKQEQVSEQQYSKLVEQLAQQQAQLADQKNQMFEVAKNVLSLRMRFHTALDEQFLNQPEESTYLRQKSPSTPQKKTYLCNTNVASDQQLLQQPHEWQEESTPFNPSRSILVNQPSTQDRSAIRESDELAIQTSIRKLASATIMLKYCSNTWRCLRNPDKLRNSLSGSKSPVSVEMMPELSKPAVQEEHPIKKEVPVLSLQSVQYQQPEYYELSPRSLYATPRGTESSGTYDAAMETAALKVQSVQRGRLVRRDLLASSSGRAGFDPLWWKLPAECQSLEALPECSKGKAASMLAETAAVRIQSIQRGKKARKEMLAKKAEQARQAVIDGRTKCIASSSPRGSEPESELSPRIDDPDNAPSVNNCRMSAPFWAGLFRSSRKSY